MGWFSGKATEQREAASTSPTPGTVAALEASTRQLVRWLRSLGGAVPPRAMELCRVIADHLEDVASDPASAHFDVQTLVTLERTASAHVPDTVEAYLAARSTPDAEAMLIEQLVLLERVASSTSARSMERAREAFEIQGSFLQEKFGGTS